MAKDAVEQYLKDLAEIYRTGGGVEEESYYGALESLLNELGRKLKPKVRCVPQLKNTGAGEPDFGLFTADQFQRSKDAKPIPGQLPERGAIECKPWDDDSFAQTSSAQISKYWKRYGIVLVTNYHDFVLVGRSENGKPVRLESFRIAQSDTEFRAMLAQPRKSAQQHGQRLEEFLRRVMLHAAPLTEPEDLAWFLASYAREARGRLEEKAHLPALEGLKNALEEALGMKFEGDKGEHFFEATLVQTLFYGVFSSWVLWCRDNWGKPDEKFDWHRTAWTLHVPMIASLFDQISTPTKLRPLGLAEVLDWAGLVLNRVDRSRFFSKFEEEHAVQYFYEPFLKAYDPELRKELGVWYTPPEIVKYQVERIDRVLREELDIADGLADDQVFVLDPCCGTGAYLVETLRRIHKTLEEKNGGALTAQKLKRAARERVFGFEILPAPFVVSHLQLGLMLRTLGAPLNAEGSERAAVYLTNALTGWEPLEDPKSLLPFPELLEEREAASRVKQDVPILVILGNPPYNAFAGTSPEEEGGLVDCYKQGLTNPVKDGGWGIKKFNLDDLYIRFFRIAERRIAKSGKGIVCFISNYSWSQEPSFVVLRKRLLQEFDKFWIENMHGNRKISEYAPDGRTSETVFAIPGFSAGIQQGITISLWVRRRDHADQPEDLASVLYRDDIDAARASDRRQQLLSSLDAQDFENNYAPAQPSSKNRYSFRPMKISKDYMAWPLVPAIGLEHYNGPVERRSFALISTVRAHLEYRIQTYFDPNVSDDQVRNIYPSLMMTGNRIVGPEARKKILRAARYDAQCIVNYPFKPFDIRFCYLDNIRPLFSEPSPRLLSQRLAGGNSFFITRDTADKSPEGPPFLYSGLVCDYDCISGHARHFPVLLKDDKPSPTDAAAAEMFGATASQVVTKANLSHSSRTYLKALAFPDPDHDVELAGLIWMHALAVGYSPLYLDENRDGIRQDWPRIPLPADKELLLRSAELGRRVAALLDTEKPLEGVTAGTIAPVLKSLGLITRVEGGPIRPDKGELHITAGWGHQGKDGVCMPGSGRLVMRPQTDECLQRAFGPETLDIYLNNAAYWSNVPKCVWDYYIGGYQVIKKWLSYRESPLLGRPLKLDEAEYVTEMVRRIAALILLQPELDANHEEVKKNTWAWPRND